MKTVKVYTAKESLVMSYGDSVPVHSDIHNISYQAGEFFDKREIETIHLPIRRFYWHDGREVFAAFDQQLLELIGCTQEQKDNELALSVEKRTKPLLGKLNQYETMTPWQLLVFLFTNKLSI
ncbi:MAG: hypothetical protein ACRC6V_01625 [Bacteroidales bacterium]